MSTGEFTHIPRAKHGEGSIANYARFVLGPKTAACRIPKPEGFAPGMRATWAWDGNGTLRIRLADTGDYAATTVGVGKQIQVQSSRVNKAVGRALKGCYATHADGLDVFIDITTEV